MKSSSAAIRVRLRVEKRRPIVRTREGHDWTERFTGVAAAATTLPDCMIDGEAVILDKGGHWDWRRCRRWSPAGYDKGVVLFAFIFERGKDIRKVPHSMKLLSSSNRPHPHRTHVP
jgi:bifunctional non-homologous end joining protein LigD